MADTAGGTSRDTAAEAVAVAQAEHTRAAFVAMSSLQPPAWTMRLPQITHAGVRCSCPLLRSPKRTLGSCWRSIATRRSCEVERGVTRRDVGRHGGRVIAADSAALGTSWELPRVSAASSWPLAPQAASTLSSTGAAGTGAGRVGSHVEGDETIVGNDSGDSDTDIILIRMSASAEPHEESPAYGEANAPGCLAGNGSGRHACIAHASSRVADASHARGGAHDVEMNGVAHHVPQSAEVGARSEHFAAAAIASPSIMGRMFIPPGLWLKVPSIPAAPPLFRRCLLWHLVTRSSEWAALQLAQRWQLCRPLGRRHFT